MLKYPLKQEILLITESGDYICKIDYAGQDTLICKDVYKRIHTDDSYFFDSFIAKEMILERDKACGFSYIEDENPTSEIETNQFKKKKTEKKKKKLLYLKEVYNDRKIENDS
ncbi:MAG: hypothetical protein ACOC22_04100 [bacterium]